ncbi:hypothetical protein COO91_01861 [Nostoc flagelliforme CCNUN1]|uniref:Uncharacterized protein n=1 Tax=Nostoc flagelliforme CCNUN1 TaxID=2038116 RepID=A0A2K8SKP3_9NOSO|nr:hypothetical protein [Nostoc flagelliforme]AUB35968.1 hypothetical protein COO91_01861 [Nostoc flagelliforme CCNUN1]
MATTATTPNVELAINTIFEVLGEPTDEWQRQALEQYKKGDAIAVKKINASHLRDFYCKCLGFLVNATSTNPALRKLLSAATNAAADHAQLKTLDKISDGNARAFESDDLVGNATQNILKFLTPQTEYHQLALASRTNYDALKELEKENPEDNLIKVLLYLTKAKPDSPALFTIIAEAGTTAALYVRNLEHQKITDAIAAALN